MLALDRRAGRSAHGLSPALILAGMLPSLWAAWLLWLAPIEGLTADRGAMAGRDFTALWTAGRLAAEHAAALLSDPASFTAYVRGLFGPGMPAQIWPYPPSILVLARAVAEMPLVSGFFLYAALSLLALAVALAFGRLAPPTIAAVLLSPAIATNLLAGQNGALVAALLAGGLLMLERRPVLAGLLFGLLSGKPQFALLLPICLVASRQWRTLAACTVSALALTAVSAVMFGIEPWLDFLGRNRSTVTSYAGASWQASGAQTIFTSAFMAARSLGAGLSAAYAAQAVATVTGAAIAWRLWLDEHVCPRRRIAATLALTLFAAPWVHTYDMPALGVAVALLIGDQSGWRRVLLVFAWLWPGLSLVVPNAPLVSLLSVATVAWVAISPAREPAALPSSA